MKRWALVLAAVLFVGGVQAWAAGAILRDRAAQTQVEGQLAAQTARADALAGESARDAALAAATRAQEEALAGALARNVSLAGALASDLSAAGAARDATWAQLNATLQARDALALDLHATQQERDARAAEEAALNLTAANLTAQLAKADADLSDARSRIFDRQALIGELQAQKAAYDQLDARYQAALDAQFPALASIQGGNVSWHFTDAEGQPHTWRYRLEDYQAYANQPRPDALLTMHTAAGATIYAADPRPYVTPAFFADKIGELTAGKTDRQFVRDAFAVKSQLVVYGFALADQGGLSYKFPAETLTEGAGLCGDTTILLASLLLAGEAQAHYGYKVKVWIVDVDPDTGVTIQDPDTVNHALVEVDFQDGAVWDLETTTSGFYLYPKVFGWSYDVTAPADA